MGFQLDVGPITSTVREKEILVSHIFQASFWKWRWKWAPIPMSGRLADPQRGKSLI